MILSETELELGEDADGIIVLADDGAGDAPAPGTALVDVLPISEPLIELEPTSNRVDCFGVYGVAREVHAVTGAPLAEAPWAGDAEATGDGEVSDLASVTVEVPGLCPRFTARVFTDVSIARSPLWLRARLLGAGMRPINNVVDITNYVMLLTAQPLHAFDLDRVPGGETPWDSRLSASVTTSTLPVRSPFPNSVPSTRSAPAITASSAAATAVPRSLCGCTLSTMLSRCFRFLCIHSI